MTSTGYLFIPLGLIVMFTSWRWMLAVLLVSSALTAAAVVNVGSFGLLPGYYMASLVIARIMLDAVRGGLLVPRELSPPLITLMVFVAIAFVSLWCAVLFFQGKVVVLGSNDQFILTRASPYQFRRENLTQYFFLLLSVALAIGLALRLCRLPLKELNSSIDFAMIAIIGVCHLLCLWQWISFNTGLPWPHDFFFTNLGYAPRDDQEILGGLRVTGPFAEPSSLAFYYAGFLFYSYRRLIGRPSVFRLSMFLACIGIMLLSKSTTALFMLGAFVALALTPPALALLNGRIPAIRITLTGIVAAIIGVSVACGAAWYVSENSDFVNNLFNTLLVDKKNSSSYLERSQSNVMALRIFVETGGLGIGIGSHQPSSMIMTLLSNTGLAGTAIFGLFLWQIITAVPKGAPIDQETSSMNSALCWCLGGLMLAHAFSSPSIASAYNWTIFGLELAVIGAYGISRRNKAAVESVYSPIGHAVAGQ